MLRVLIIDDDAQIVGTLIDFIELVGKGSIVCDYAHEVLKAQSLTFANPYDLIITDYHLPFQNGLSFVKSLRTQDGPNQNTAIIMISGYIAAIDSKIHEVENLTLMEKPLQFDILEKQLQLIAKQRGLRA